jgi:hypothetical protein
MAAIVRSLAVVAFFGACAGALARDEDCAGFAWPIEADAALIARAELIDSGATLDLAVPKGVRVVLVDPAEAGFRVPPAKPFAPSAPGGTLRFEAEAGIYQFTMTDRVWLDVVQAGRKIEQAAFSGAPDCDGARKSIRFRLEDGPALIQLSSSPARTTAIAITRSPKDKAGDGTKNVGGEAVR